MAERNATGHHLPSTVITVDASHCPVCGAELSAVDRDGRERRFCRSCDRVVWRNAIPTADVIVLDGCRGLLVERGVEPHRGLWCAPGGHMEYDEPPAAAAVSELREETGVDADVEDLGLVDAVLEEFDDHARVSLVYAVPRAATTGSPEPGGDAVAARFRPIDAVDDLVPAHRRPVETLLGADESVR